MQARAATGMSGPDTFAQLRRARRLKLEQALRSMVRQLRELGALKIILFGSLARGDMDVDSDIDLFVMMPSTRSGKEWLRIVNDRLDRKAAADVIVFNREEFNRESGTNCLLGEIASSGRTLYEKAA